MGRADLRFRREQISRSDLHRRSAEHECGCNPACVSDAASGDHRNVHRVDNQRNQRKGPDLAAQVITEEHPAMPSGFIAHGDDRVAAVLLQPHRFFNGGGR
ncbi:hypothetical protein D3C72_2238980 [compost metagenome]